VSPSSGEFRRIPRGGLPWVALPRRPERPAVPDSRNHIAPLSGKYQAKSLYFSKRFEGQSTQSGRTVQQGSAGRSRDERDIGADFKFLSAGVTLTGGAAVNTVNPARANHRKSPA
jgi:hypothetical protein